LLDTERLSRKVKVLESKYTTDFNVARVNYLREQKMKEKDFETTTRLQAINQV